MEENNRECSTYVIQKSIKIKILKAIKLKERQQHIVSLEEGEFLSSLNQRQKYLYKHVQNSYNDYYKNIEEKTIEETFYVLEKIFSVKNLIYFD